MQDAAGNRYSATRANRFGGSVYDPDANEPIALTSADKFVIRTATGGVFGMVNVEHIQRADRRGVVRTGDGREVTTAVLPDSEL